MDALAHGHFGEADEDRLGQAGGDVNLGLDGNAVDADQGKGVQLGEHEGQPRRTTDTGRKKSVLCLYRVRRLTATRIRRDRLCRRPSAKPGTAHGR